MSGVGFNGNDESRPPFTLVDNRVMDRTDLTPIDRAVYGHYKRWAYKGCEKKWRELGYKHHPYSINEMVRVLGISRGAISQSRKKLAGDGYKLIDLRRVNRTKTDDQSPHENRFFFEVTILDLGSPDEPKSASKVHTVNLQGSPGERLLNKEKTLRHGANAPRVDKLERQSASPKIDAIEDTFARATATSPEVKRIKTAAAKFANAEDVAALAIAFWERAQTPIGTPTQAKANCAAASELLANGAGISDLPAALAEQRRAGTVMSDLWSIKRYMLDAATKRASGRGPKAFDENRYKPAPGFELYGEVRK